jgi:hypothetical protein
LIDIEPAIIDIWSSYVTFNEIEKAISVTIVDISLPLMGILDSIAYGKNADAMIIRLQKSETEIVDSNTFINEPTISICKLVDSNE